MRPTAERLDEFLVLASRRLKVSRQVVLRRLRDLSPIGSDLYQRTLDALLEEEQQTKRGGWAVSPEKRCLRQNGKLFTSLVLEARERNLIPYADVADYLSLRLRYLEAVQSTLATVAA